jgi:hypothetical protein
MNKKLVSLLVISFFALTLVASTAPAMGATQAQGTWITQYTVDDLSNGGNLMSGPGGNNQLLQGTSVKVTMTISISITVPDSTLTLTTGLSKAATKDKFWELETTDYQMSSGYNPNSQTVSFNQVAGTFIITCYGTIPLGLTTTSQGSTTLHLPYAFSLITLTGPNSQQLDQIKPWVIDDRIAMYNGLNSQSNNTLSQLVADGAAPAYVQLYNNVMQGAAALAQEGFVDTAIIQLQSLAVSEEPPVQASASLMDTLFIPVAGVLAAVAVIGLVLFFRAKGKSSYVSQVVEDQIRDLEGLTLRASKVDRSLSAGLETIEERLKRAVGA